MGGGLFASSDSNSCRRVSNGSLQKSRSLRQSRSKNTTDAGVCCDKSFARDAAGCKRSCNASKSSSSSFTMTNSPSSTQRSGKVWSKGSISSGKYRLRGFSSLLWMKISSPSRNTIVRNPSHLGSKIQSPSAGISSTRLASMGRTGGLTRRFTS